MLPIFCYSQNSQTLPEVKRINILNELAYQIRVSFPDSAMNLCEDAIQQSKKIKYKIGECDALITMGLIYWLRVRIDMSIECGMTALKIGDSLAYKRGAMEANLLLGQVYKELEDFEKSEAFSRHGLVIGLELHHAEGIARACNALGNHYRRKKEGAEALRFYEMGLKYLENRNDIAIKSLLLDNIAVYHIERNEEQEKTKRYLDEAMKIALAFKNRSAELSTYIRLGTFYKSIRELSKAEENFKIAEKMSIELGYGNALLEVYGAMITIKTKIGKDKEADEYEAKYAILKDSLFNFRKARQIAELENRYEAAQKEQTIKLLEKEKEIQATWRNALVGGVGITFIASLLIYRLQRSRTQKTRQLLEVQQLLNTKLKEINQINSRFFANVSHEFRTPLTLVLSPLEEIQKNKSLTEKEQELLTLTKRNASRLLDLVNQLLDLSKLEAGKMELQVKPGDAESFLKDIASSFDTIAESKKIKFEKRIFLNRPHLWFDPDKLEKIIANLLANAFKFTPANGSVTLQISLAKSNTNDIIIIQVIDTGSGISMEEQPYVFLPFYQTKHGIEGSHPGTGIGLSLVHELVKVYNGDISFQSNSDNGTMFMVSLPANKEAFAPSQVFESFIESHIPVTGTKLIDNNQREPDLPVLDYPRKESLVIAEDNIELLNFLASRLKSEFIVHTAANGEEALQIIQRVIPDLVLTDLMMPKMDGMQLIQKIKSDIRTQHIPVVLLTAKNEQETRIQGLKMGADDYITKPFSTEELQVRISKLIRRKQLN
ncbi:hypothetical protein WSM22_44180 [Cytophagales bacterium WSM2-2]|nr:hypothetical protein WSM22_44180 [Cytophagales bacterium WSM2-2]